MTDPAATAIAGRLDLAPAADHPELLAEPVARTVREGVPSALVSAIDPSFADTEALCAEYGIPVEACANAVVVRGVRAGDERFAVCLTLAHRRLDVNGLIKRRLDVRKASFAPMDLAVEATGMEYGGITPVGAPEGWPIWVDAAVADAAWLCIGSGIRGSKLFVSSADLLALPCAERVDILERDIG